MGSLLGLYKGAGAVFVGKAGHILFGLSLQLLLVRHLSVEDYGLYVYIIALVAVFAVPVQLGLHIPILRFTSSLVAEGRHNELARLLRFTIGLGLATSLSVCLAGQFLLLSLGNGLSNEIKFALQIGIALIMFRSVLLMVSRALLGTRKMVAAHWPEKIAIPIMMIVLVFLVTTFTNLNIETVLVLRVLVVGIISLVTFRLLLVGLPILAKFPIDAKSVSGREIFAVALPMLFASTVNILANKADVLLAGQILSMTDVAQYAVVKRVAAITGFGLAAILSACSPFISAANTLGKKKRLANILFASALLSTVFALFVLGLFSIIGPSKVLRYFGDQYLAGSDVLVVLLFGQLLDSVFGVTGMLMAMTGHQRIFLQSVIMGLVVSSISIILLSMQFGLAGVAWGFVIGVFIRNIYMVVYSLKELNVNPTVFNLLWTKKEKKEQLFVLLLEIKNKAANKLRRTGP